MERITQNLHLILLEVRSVENTMVAIPKSQRHQTGSTGHETRFLQDEVSSNIDLVSIKRRLYRRLIRILKDLEIVVDELLQGKQNTDRQKIHVDEFGETSTSNTSEAELNQDISKISSTDESGAKSVTHGWESRSDSKVRFTVRVTKGEEEGSRSIKEDVIPNQLLEDLIYIMTSLTMPYENESCFQLSSSIIDIVTQIWLQVSLFLTTDPCGRNKQTMTREAICSILDRIITHERVVRSSIEISSPDNQRLQLDLFTPLLGLMEVVKYHFDWMEKDGTSSSVDHIHIENRIENDSLIRMFPVFLDRSIESVQSKQWEQGNIGDPVVELYIQWRILTGQIFNRLKFLKEESAETASALLYLTRLFETTESSESYQFRVPSTSQLHSSSGNASQKAQRYVNRLTQYATELSSFAIDVLDGATVLFLSPEDRFALKKSPSGDLENLASDFQPTSLEPIIQDCLRHATMAIYMLEAVQPWCDVESQAWHHLLLEQKNLWRAIATSFLDSPIRRQLNDRYAELGSNLGYGRMLLTDQILQNTEKIALEDYPNWSLAFLRSFDYPDLLLLDIADSSWSFYRQIHSRQLNEDFSAESERDVKHLLQAAHITLGTCVKTAGYHHSSTNDIHSNPSFEKTSNHLLLEKMFQMLPKEEQSNTESSSGRVISSPWEQFVDEKFATI